MSPRIRRLTFCCLITLVIVTETDAKPFKGGIKEEIKDVLRKNSTTSDHKKLFARLQRSASAIYLSKVYKFFQDSPMQSSLDEPMLQAIPTMKVFNFQDTSTLKFELGAPLARPLKLLELVLDGFGTSKGFQLIKNALKPTVTAQLYRKGRLLRSKNFKMNETRSRADCLVADLSSIMNSLQIYSADAINISMPLHCNSTKCNCVAFQRALKRSLPLLIFYHETPASFLVWKYLAKDIIVPSYKYSNHKRGSRGASYSSPSACHRASFTVKFDLLPQSNVIMPRAYDAFVCQGKCRYPVTSFLNATNHAVLQGMLASLSSNGHPPPVCCAPTAFSPIDVLYLDQNNMLVLARWKEMVVEECACR